MIDSANAWSDFRTTFGGKDNLGFNEITFELNETNNNNGSQDKKQVNALVHFNNNVTTVSDNKDTGEINNQKHEPLNDIKDVKTDSVFINLGMQTSAIVHPYPYNSTPLYSVNEDSDNDDNLNKLHQNFRNFTNPHTQTYILNATKLERASPIQRSISNVSNSIPLCKLSKGKACRLFNECDAECSDQENEIPVREYNKTVRYPMQILIDGPYGSLLFFTID